MARPKKNPKDVRVPITAAVLPEIETEIQSIAIAQDRTKSAIAEKLLLRGLAAFKVDGKLTSEAPKVPAKTTSVKSIKPKRRITDDRGEIFASNGEPMTPNDEEAILKDMELEELEEEEKRLRGEAEEEAPEK